METIGKFSVVVLTFGLLVATNAWPSGAPDTACNSFRPWHTDADDKPYRAENEDHVGRDDVNCPYSLTASSDFIPGQSITCKSLFLIILLFFPYQRRFHNSIVIHIV